MEQENVKRVADLTFIQNILELSHSSFIFKVVYLSQNVTLSHDRKSPRVAWELGYESQWHCLSCCHVRH